MNKNYTKATKFVRPITTMIRLLVLFVDCSWAGIEVLVGVRPGILHFTWEKEYLYEFLLCLRGTLGKINFFDLLWDLI